MKLTLAPESMMNDRFEGSGLFSIDHFTTLIITHAMDYFASQFILSRPTSYTSMLHLARVEGGRSRDMPPSRKYGPDQLSE